MKLRNKKTGEIGYFCFANSNDPVLIIMDKNGIQLAKYNSLTELNEEWEDYEEPKDFWYINEFGTPTKADFVGRETLYDKCRKDFGNYFETEEEAELAVCKLKAWKRLKDKGFVFKGINMNDGSIKTGLSKEVSWNDCEGFYSDMELLFGGEE